jgi:hypothetical protein
MEITAGHGVAHGVNGAHVGLTCENGRAEWARLTPIPQAHSDSPGRSPWLMLPWTAPLCITSHAVHSATERVCDE